MAFPASVLCVVCEADVLATPEAPVWRVQASSFDAFVLPGKKAKGHPTAEVCSEACLLKWATRWCVPAEKQEERKP